MDEEEAQKARFEVQLKQARAKLLALKAGAAKTTTDGKAGMSEQVETMKESVSEAEAMLAAPERFDAEDWADHTAGLEDTWTKVSDSLKSNKAPKAKPADPGK